MNATFTRALPKEPEDFADKQQTQYKSTVMEPTFPFITLVELIEAEDDTIEKNRPPGLLLENFNVTSKLPFQNLSAESFTEASDPNIRSKPQLPKYYTYCRKSIQSVSNYFREQREDAGRKQNKYYPQFKSFVKSLK